MIAVLQRVYEASVKIEGKTVGEIAEGLLIYLGVAEGDTREDAERLAAKIAACRIFCDEQDKMNLSVRDIGGEALVISNFTLLADYHHGNRPSFFGSAAPAEAEALYKYFVSLLTPMLKKVACGVFGADMKVGSVVNGPVNIVMDSRVLLKPRKERVQ